MIHSGIRQYVKDVFNCQYKCKLAHKQWTTLYIKTGAKKLKTAKMSHLFKHKYSNETMAHVDDFCDGDNHLEEF